MIARQIFFPLLLIVAALGLPASAQRRTPAYEVQGKDTTCQIFMYSPGPKDGLHVAYFADNGAWQDVGQLCSSDYGPWGAEKKMYSPYVIHAQDGTWRLLFSVGGDSPCLAAAYSEDLVTWRPQDYPKVSERGVRDPIMFQMDPDNIDIYFKAKDGSRHYMQASNDFRHFSESADASTIEDAAWIRDTMTLGNRHYEGNAFDVPKIQLDYLCQYFDAVANESMGNGETMSGDAKRFASVPGTVKATLDVNVAKSKSISNKLLGVFFEDISHAADGGLYAELLQNRDFEYSPFDHRGWTPVTSWSYSGGDVHIAQDGPVSAVNPHYAVLQGKDTLYNAGWGGITVAPLQQFDFSFYARVPQGQANHVLVALVDNSGNMLAKAKIKVDHDGWWHYAMPLIVGKKYQKRDVRLALIPTKDGRVDVDMVSLFPHNTFKGHGLRQDLAEAIAALHPKFVRFPGGCMSHGQGINNIYHWNESVGAWQDRTPAKNIWGYHQTRGLGFYEYFQFCEDIGAEPLPVLAAGVPCQNSVADSTGYAGQQGGIPMKDMSAYCQEILDLIEWANGDPATSKWAKMRADAGHAAPFNLKYIGIGNEDLISTTFEQRYGMICSAIKKKYPDIVVCGTVGPFHNPSPDYIEGWKFAKSHQRIIDMVDEHYYESPGWFLHHQDYYDGYDRKGPKVYLGEWASHGRRVENALVEAVHLCNIERNADVVAMSSYAPLLCREGNANWNPNLIYFNRDSITALTPSYYVQKMWGCNPGTEYVESSLSLPDSLGYRVAASVVKNTATGHTLLRLVNALPVELDMQVKGIALPAETVCSSLEGQPQSLHINKVGYKTTKAGFIALHPYSVTLVTL